MYRIVSGILTLSQHIEMLFSKPEVHRPLCCLNCKHDVLWNHGCYYREVIRGLVFDDGSLNPIPIPRYLCPSCWQSCSRLPKCIPPRRWYSRLS